MNPAASAEETAAASVWLKTQRPRAGRWVALAIGLEFANGLLLIAQAWFLAKTLNAVVFDDAGLSAVTHWLWTIFCLFSLRALLSWMSEQAAFEAAAQVKLHVRDRLLRHLFTLGPVKLALERSGDLTTALSDGVEALEAYYARYLPAMTLMVLLPLSILVVVLPFDWLAAAIFLCTAPMIPLFMILIGKGAERLNQRQWRRLARLAAHFLDVIQGLTTLKLFNASRREAENIAQISEEYRHDTMAVLRVAFLSSLALEFFATVSIALVAVAIGFRLLWGDMDFMPAFFILLLAPEFYLPLRNMGTHYHARMEAIGAAERLVRLLAMEPPPISFERSPVPELSRSTIRYRDVSAVYPDGTHALRDIDFDIQPGERLAIVGPSGAGKTTLINLLLGFVQPDKGRVFVADTSLDTLDPSVWREQLSWVPQRPHLYAGSVADNIRLSRPEASSADVETAARLAYASDFIERLPQGYETQIGEGGVGLSGGQAQRIALARAFLWPAPLLLLDEPTANLDRESERLIQMALDRLVDERTLVVIAHRLDTVRGADRILVIEQGRLVDQGGHDDLLDRCETYRRLVEDFAGRV